VLLRGQLRQVQVRAGDHAIRAQARATADVAAANFKKAQILQDQAALSLFTMPEGTQLSAQAREYLELRREEELEKLRERIATTKAEAARRKAEAARRKAEAEREAAARTQEVDVAVGRCVPPAPLAPEASPRPPCMQSPTAGAPGTTVQSPAPNSGIGQGVGEGDLGDSDYDDQETPFSQLAQSSSHVHDLQEHLGERGDVISETQVDIDDGSSGRVQG
jgi:multidrug efflux pump subunit AcrA (membrane-fusion protein)